MITKEQTQEVTNIIVQEIEPEKVLLFGSYAAGLPNKHSDVDIIVIVNGALNKKDKINTLVKLNMKMA